ncbi:MAG: outer membrane beta-barrel family protein [Bacteroidota bacterium]
MKQFLFLMVLITGSFTLSAQAPAGAPTSKTMTATTGIGHVYGKLVDSANKPISDASVAILQSKYDTITKKSKQVMLKGVATKSNGDFSFEDLPTMGQLTIKISAVGYKAMEQNISFSKPQMGAPTKAPGSQVPDFSSLAANTDKDLGNIALQADAHELGNIVVTGNNKGLRLDIDKKVFNVEQNLVSAGGTAADVLKNVPSLNVDIDGKVTLRNATPQLYIDGRPTTLTVDQIPADAIESVEVITNPSAKYDASGGNAGILNLVLKKNKKSGYNGNINAGIDKRGGVNGGGSFNIRQNKINFTASTFGNQMKNRNTASTDIESLLSSSSMLVNQSSKERMNGGFLFGRLGADYFVTNRLTLSAGVVRVHGEFNPSTTLQTDSAFKGGQYLSYSERNTSNNRTFNATGVQGGFKLLFPKQGQELTGDFNIFSGKNNNSSLYNTDIFSSKGGLQTGNIQQQIIGNGTNKFTTLQSDYVTPIKGGGKLEAGARVQLRNLTNSQGNYIYDNASKQFVLIPSASSNYKNKDNVYAAYASFSNSIKDFGYKVGLRAESSNYEGELTDSKQTFTNNYPVSLFPSIFVSQKLKNKQELQASFTRRINRPFFMQLIPFIDSTDQLNWSKGNAGLKPEFTSTIEASYTKTFKGNNSILASVYYKHTTDLITRYLDTISVNGGEQHPINTYINANSGRSAGFEITSQNQLAKWWDMNTNLNIYNSKINTDNINGTSQEALWSWFAKMNNNFKLPANFKLQLSGTYQSKTNLPVNQNTGFNGGPPMSGGAQSASQGFIKANFGVDAALQKSFLKNNAASFTLSINDIFSSRKTDQYVVSDYYIQNSHRLGDVPMFRLSFAYRFGQMDMSLFKRKNMKGESEGAQSSMQGM